MRIVVFLFVLSIAGCVSDVANRYYVQDRYPAREPGTVELFNTSPTRPFTVIADFQTRGDSPQSLREKAAAIGADAIIVTGIGGSGNSSDWADGPSTDYSHIIGTAIKYK